MVVTQWQGLKYFPAREDDLEFKLVYRSELRLERLMGCDSSDILWSTRPALGLRSGIGFDQTGTNRNHCSTIRVQSSRKEKKKK